MKVSFRNIKKFQAGGPMPAEDPAAAGGEAMPPEAAGAPAEPEAGGGENPLMLIAQAAMQALQSQDCNMAMQVCEAFVQLVQQAQGGGAAPEQAPEALGEPVYRAGGRLVRKIRK